MDSLFAGYSDILRYTFLDLEIFSFDVRLSTLYEKSKILVIWVVRRISDMFSVTVPDPVGKHLRIYVVRSDVEMKLKFVKGIRNLLRVY